MPDEPDGVAPPPSLVELRLLIGPNLYFPRPAAKLTLDITGLLLLPQAQAQALAGHLGLTRARPRLAGPPGAPGPRPAPAGSGFRQRFAARCVARLVRRLAAEAGVSRLAVRSRPGPGPTQLMVAYPWRRSGRAEALGEAVAGVLDELTRVATDTDVAAVLARAG